MSEDDDIRNRYASRFKDEDEDDRDDGADEDNGSAGNDMRDQNEENVGSVWNAGNVKQDWKGWTIYLPEPFLDDVRDESKLLDVRLDRDVKMDRHFKPLLIALGKERLESMEDEEVMEFMERMEQGEL